MQLYMELNSYKRPKARQKPKKVYALKLWKTKKSYYTGKLLRDKMFTLADWEAELLLTGTKLSRFRIVRWS